MSRFYVHDMKYDVSVHSVGAAKMGRTKTNKNMASGCLFTHFAIERARPIKNFKVHLRYYVNEMALSDNSHLRLIPPDPTCLFRTAA